MSRPGRKNLLCILLLAAAMGIVFVPELFCGRTPIGGDIEYQNFPRMVFISESLKRGEVPLWSPYIYSGYPLAAEGQSGVFYPPNLLLPLLSRAAALPAMIMLHVFLAAVFMFVFVRMLGFSRSASLLSAIVYSLNGFSLARIQHTNILYTLAWAPLLLASIEAMLVRRGERAFARAPLAAACAAVVLVALQPQFALYVLVAGAVYFVFSAHRNRVPGARAVAAGAAAAFFALALSAVQLLPLAELTRYTARSSGAGAFEFFSTGSLNPRMFIQFILPHFWGAPWDSTYRAGGSPSEVINCIGALPLMLAAAWILVRNKRAELLPFILLAAFGFVFALGSYSPAGSVFYHIPLVNSFRIPARMMYYVALLGALLAGAGLDSLTAGVGFVHGRATRLFAGLFAVAAVAAGGLAAVLFSFRSRAVEMLSSRFGTQFASDATHSADYYREKIRLLVEMADRDLFSLFIAFAIVAALIVFAIRRGIRPNRHRIIAAAVVVAAFVELVVLSSDFINRTERSVLLHRPALVAKIKKGEGFNRVYSTQSIKYLQSGDRDSISSGPDFWRRNLDTLDYEIPQAFGVYSINGYGSLTLKDFQTLIHGAGYRFNGSEKNAGELDPVKDRATLDLLKVGYVIRAAADGRSMEMVALEPKRNKSPIFVRCEGSRSLPGDDPVAIPGNETRWRRSASGRVVVSADMPCDGVFVLSEKYYPGWIVRELVNSNMINVNSFDSPGGIAINLGRGKHELEYVFAPVIARVGLAVSLAALGLAVGTVVFGRKRAG